MKLQLKKIQDQVIAVVGASSGMGLRVAQMAAQRGAKVLLVARNEDALKDAVNEIRAFGGQAIYAVADVTDYNQLQAAANTAIQEYGKIDSWIHIAGVGHWGLSEDVQLEDAKKLFDINFWGLVNGTRIAMKLMREKGGAIINMGSVESDRAIPFHSFYAASKHAIKGYTEALRVECEQQGLPLSFTLIKPASINTPFVEHSRNQLRDAHPKMLPPVYHVDIAAKAILECCEVPHRDVTIGGSGLIMETMERVAPRFFDRLLKKSAFEQQKRYDLPIHYRDNLEAPLPVEGFTEGLHNGRVSKTSLATDFMMHPLRSSFYVLGGLGIAALLVKSNSMRMRSSAFQENEDHLSSEDLKELHYKTPDLSSDPTSAYSANPSPS